MKFLVLVPSIMLMHQLSRTMFNLDIKHNMYGTNETEKDKEDFSVDLSVYNSVKYVMKNKYDYVIIDEAHKVFVPKVLE